jgi:hypothetical protein
LFRLKNPEFSIPTASKAGGGGPHREWGVTESRRFVKCVAIQKRLGIPDLGGGGCGSF